ncbi:MAG: glycosyltransferase family 39 protein, partial [Candidatus Aenigmarchaeota archaeon]|nr:glycosyltransferase family 39 protein [Candidatus Aenigmarchaeota archaeon]
MNKKFLDILKKNLPLILLIIIFIFSLNIRVSSANSKWLSAYDPYFQYRYTKDVVENGVLPSWDVYSYYPPGRKLNVPPLMYYLTGYLFLIFNPLLGISLMKFCGIMAAIYGALGVIPAYFLGKEFSNKKAGLLSAFFVGFSPAILTRTLGGFYDTDGLVIFFSLLTMYLLVRAFRKRTYLDYGFAGVGLILFGLTWTAAWYIPSIVLISIIFYFFILVLIGNPEWKDDIKKSNIFSSERIKAALSDFKSLFIPFLIIFILASLIDWLLGSNPLGRILNLFVFAQDPARVLIVNISVAELQPLNVFGEAWSELFARIGIPFIFTIPGSLLLLKRNRKNGAILLIWAGISFFAITRGIRFMLVFAPAACIASSVFFSEAYKYLKNMGPYAPIISFGVLVTVISSMMKPSLGFLIGILLALLILFNKKSENNDNISKSVFMASIIIVILITMSQGLQMTSGSMSEPINKNWADAYLWLKNDTAKDAVVGSWWDPGHRIAGISERRNIADGAHCPDEYCKPGLNTRIVDLGKIFSTTSEDEAKNILLKYRGNSSEMYWIVSDDLIGK